MAVNTEAAFSPTGKAELGASSTSARVAFPTSGTPTIVRVTNNGQTDAFLLMGDNTVVATVSTGLALLARTSIFLTIGANTNLAAVTQANGTALTVDVGN